MYYPLAVSVAGARCCCCPARRRRRVSSSPSLSASSTAPPPPWRTRLSSRRSPPIAAVPAEGGGGDDDDFFALDLDDFPAAAAADEEGEEGPWEGAVVYRRDAAVHHLEFATTLGRLGLGDLSSPDSRARAAAMGILSPAKAEAEGEEGDTPVLVSVDVTRRRRGRLRLDGIVRTVITLGCFRCAEPAPEGIFANFSLLLSEDPVEEPDVVDLGTIYEEDVAKGPSLTGTQVEEDEDIDWDDRLHFPAAEKEIDISKNIRDIIHLEITLDAVCSPTCKGLCLLCGTNLNTSTCGCSREKPQEPKDVKRPGPLKELLRPVQRR
ncbi:hypothetical protein ACP4OV_000011 [Aristida adscensionis]